MLSNLTNPKYSECQAAVADADSASKVWHILEQARFIYRLSDLK